MTAKEFLENIILTRGQWNEEVYASGICEMHHITLASKNGEGDFLDKKTGKWKFRSHSHNKNCIYLYPHEHFEVHRLEYEENPTDPSCYWAYWRMAQIGDKEGFIDKWEYENARKVFIESISGPRSSFAGENNPRFGKVNIYRKGKPAWNSGKTNVYSEEILEKLRTPKSKEARENMKRPHSISDESRKSWGCTGKSSSPRSIYCNETNKVYNCMSDAARELDLSVTQISNYAKGARKHSVKGYTFKFIEEVNNE